MLEYVLPPVLAVLFAYGIFVCARDGRRRKQERRQFLDSQGKVISIALAISGSRQILSLVYVDFCAGEEAWIIYDKEQEIDYERDIFVDGLMLESKPSRREFKELLEVHKCEHGYVAIMK